MTAHTPSNRDAFLHLLNILHGAECPALSPALEKDPAVAELHRNLVAVREFFEELNTGGLPSKFNGTGKIAESAGIFLTALRGLVENMKQVSQGDYSPRVKMLGEFAPAFNGMVLQQHATVAALRENERVLTGLTANLRKEVEDRSDAVCALRESEAKFKYLAEHDPLTGAMNRRSFLDLAEASLREAHEKNESCCVALLDIDNFKAFNDVYGHLDGDEALRHTVLLASACLRQADLLGRYGGEEFIFFFSNADLAQGSKAAERIRQAIESSAVKVSGHDDVRITASFGISAISPEWPGQRNAEFLAQYIRQADDALYRAKDEGRNKVYAAPIQAPEPCPEDEKDSVCTLPEAKSLLF